MNCIVVDVQCVFENVGEKMLFIKVEEIVFGK